MSEITPVEVGRNHHAPEGSAAIYMYKTATSGELTLAQLVAAVTLRVASANEARSVITMNRLNSQSIWATALSNIIRYVCEENLDAKRTWDDDIRSCLPKGYVPKWPDFEQDANKTLGNFFEKECGISHSALPEKLDDLTQRLDAYAQIKPISEDAARQIQMLQVELKSSMSRRDVAFSTSANTMKTLFSSMTFSADSMKPIR